MRQAAVLDHLGAGSAKVKLVEQKKGCNKAATIGGQIIHSQNNVLDTV